MTLRYPDRILQITTATPGWYAIYKHPENEPIEARIAIWALVEYDATEEADKFQDVIGMDFTITEANLSFAGIDPGQGYKFEQYVCLQ